MVKLHILDGPDKKKNFQLSADNFISVGRSPDCTIQINDRSVSRKHLEIILRDQKPFIRDLKSTNGTFVNGTRIDSELEVEIQEGLPIVIGATIICLGKGCVENIAPFLDATFLTYNLDETGKLTTEARTTTAKKNLEFSRKTNHIIDQTLDANEILEKILDYILDLLNRVDRAAIILFDNESKDILNTIIRSREPDKSTTLYSQHVIQQAIQENKAILVTDVQNVEESELSNTLKLLKIRSVMCAPLISASQVSGVIYIDSINEPNGFRKSDLYLLTSLSDRIVYAVENAFLHRQWRGV